jgi:hypothetical protein
MTLQRLNTGGNTIMFESEMNNEKFQVAMQTSNC